MLNIRKRCLTMSCCKVKPLAHGSLVLHMVPGLFLSLWLSTAWAGGGHSGSGAKAGNHTSVAYMAYAAAAITNARTSGKNTTGQVVGPAAAGFNSLPNTLHKSSRHGNSSHYSNHSRLFSKTSKARAVQSHKAHFNQSFSQPASASSEGRNLAQSQHPRPVGKAPSLAYNPLIQKTGGKKLSAPHTKAIKRKPVHLKEAARQARAGYSQVTATSSAATARGKVKTPKTILPTLNTRPYKGKQGTLASAIYDHNSYDQSRYEPYALDDDTGLEHDIEHLTLQESQGQEEHLQGNPRQQQTPTPVESQIQTHYQYQQGWKNKAINIAQMALMALASLSTDHPMYSLVAFQGFWG